MKILLSLKTNNIFKHICSMAYVIAIIFVIVYPMRLAPLWNGEIPGHRNQYELQAEAFLNGHLYLDLDVSAELKAMKNPYDTVARQEYNIDFMWDHAYYNEHYYMYFGVVPVILLFLPYRVITGEALTTYHATQFYTAGIVLCFFILFYYLKKKFFDKMPFLVYMIFTTSLSFASTWYFAAAPALYCTAISAGVFHIMWSFFFFIRAAYDGMTNKRLLFCGLGALCGALSFGCRPPVALSNILFVPLVLMLLGKLESKKEKIATIITIVLPYVIIGILLALYNYLRFDNPFEFGQAYQLTASDQHEYSILSRFNLRDVLNGFRVLFFHSDDMDETFPYIRFSGIFFEFPIFLVGLGCAVFSENLRISLKENKLRRICISVFVSIFLSAFVMLKMSPSILERYKSDYIFLLSIWVFIVFAGWITSANNSKRIRIRCLWIVILSVLTAITSILLFFVPNDCNYVCSYPDVLEKIRSLMWKF